MLGKQASCTPAMLWQFGLLLFKRCSCRWWALSGIPCSHAIACLKHEGIQPTMVSACFSRNTYINAYAYNISQNIEIQDCSIRCGGKKKKELDGADISKKDVTLLCSYCKKDDHTIATCGLRFLAVKGRMIAGGGDATCDDPILLHVSLTSSSNKIKKLSYTLYSLCLKCSNL